MSRKKKSKKTKEKKPAAEALSSHKKTTLLGRVKSYYLRKFKLMLVIPLALFILSLSILTFHYLTTGEFIERDVTLKGGISVTVKLPRDINIQVIQDLLETKFNKASVNVRSVKIGEQELGLVVEASGLTKEEIISTLEEVVGKIDEKDYSTETMGSSLGRSFFEEMFKALIVAFLFMGAVFFFYFSEYKFAKMLIIALAFLNFSVLIFSKSAIAFLVITLVILAITIYTYIRYSIPTLAALISAFLDIFITLGIITFMGIKLTSGGIAAFLMLIGYSIDTSILLSTKILKGDKEHIDSALFSAMKTGLTMSIAGLVATFTSYLLTNNATLKQIMLILVIGLFMDIITTWIGNVSLLRLYLERKNVKA